jgi:hypothetical protein
MNRKDRRAQRAQERKARRTDTMGTSFHIGPLPEHVTNHPAFQEGKRAAEKGEGFPPQYYDDIEKAAKLIAEWVHAQPTPPDLRWIEQKDDGVFIAAALDDAGASYLADSPDAFALLAWLDEKTGRKLSLNQAMWALRRCRALPLPDGSYYGVTTSHESDAYKTFLRMADRVAKHDESDRGVSSPCGHCGKQLDAASTDTGHKPNAGDLSVCVYCCGANMFDAELRLVKLTEEQLDALPPESAAQLREMQALMRSTIAKAFRGKAKGPAAEA